MTSRILRKWAPFISIICHGYPLCFGSILKTSKGDAEFAEYYGNYSDYKTSSGKRNLLHLIHPLHLRLEIRAVSDFVLFGKLVRLKYALYAVPVRQTEALLWASFRLRLTTDALALC